ncbi:MobA/MobL family protein [Sphingomonas sp. GM_Shp_1]|uniref:MobA/MobL family protein n=1 Tax=Sphingomonas sp. GM_Shp_1 TaxID=2937381 RepID=UPI00226B53F6|nr:MobA/MobL family protein [Sphingomonas sp. GM_Shp_1]
MSIQRPLGPIGHCSARLRRLLAIEEEEALGRTVRVRRNVRDAVRDRKPRGNRWSRSPDFAVPGAFHQRFVSVDGKVTFNFTFEAVSKTSDGGCQIKTSEGTRRLEAGAPKHHDAYIDRPEAVEVTISADGFDRYAVRPSATEAIDGERAVFSNISPDPWERKAYWQAVHEHERTPGVDRLTLMPENASRGAWQALASAPDAPEAVRDVAAAFATARGKRKTRTIPLDDLAVNGAAARKLAKTLATILGTGKKKAAARVSKGRGGRTQYRLTAEFPDGLDAAGRRTVTQAICDRLDSFGIMYVAAIHAPDHHNDRRNHHLHLACHDRPARKIGDRWDFTIAETVAGQHGRVRYPYAQKKVADWSRDSAGGNHRDYGTTMVAEMRTFFADRCNEELDRLGVTRRFHPGTLRSLGCERDGQKPLGTRAAPLDAVGVPTARSIDNAELLWSALLREAWTAAEERTKARTTLRRRLAEAERRFAEGTVVDQAHVVAIRDLTARLDAADTVLRQHDAECAEYDVTLAMARARPDKTITVCRRILKAIGEGKADSAEQRANAAIAARADAAEAFLASIAAIEHDHAPELAKYRTAVTTAQAEVEAIADAAKPLIDRSAPARTPEPARPDPRATLEALFDRIMADDMPILPPEGTVAGYRVPGVTRAEFAALTTPALAEMAQKRLAVLADIQAKRMTAAAKHLASVGTEVLTRAAADGDPGAARTLKHVRAYGAHPVYLRALAEAQKTEPPVTAPAEKTGRTWRDFIGGLLGHNPPVQPSTPIEPTPQPPVPEPAKDAALSPRDEAIAALAAALLADPALRVAEGKHGLVIDTADAPDWRVSADVFADAPAVLDAMRRRHAAPWLDHSAIERNRLLADLHAALMGSLRPPLRKVGEQWDVDLTDKRLAALVTHWRGYDSLDALLTDVDHQWRGTDVDRYIVEGSTSVGTGDATVSHVPDLGTDRGDGLHDDRAFVPMGWGDWGRGRSGER